MTDRLTGAFGNERSALTERALVLLSMLLIGEGALYTFDPQRYLLVWRDGPPAWERFIDSFIERPTMMRTLGILEVGAGLWLASRLGAPARFQSRRYRRRAITAGAWE